MVCPAVSMLNVFVFNNLADVVRLDIQSCAILLTFRLFSCLVWCLHPCNLYTADFLAWFLNGMYFEWHDFWFVGLNSLWKNVPIFIKKAHKKAWHTFLYVGECSCSWLNMFLFFHIFSDDTAKGCTFRNT